MPPPAPNPVRFHTSAPSSLPRPRRRHSSRSEEPPGFAMPRRSAEPGFSQETPTFSRLSFAAARVVRGERGTSVPGAEGAHRGLSYRLRALGSFFLLFFFFSSTMKRTRNALLIRMLLGIKEIKLTTCLTCPVQGFPFGGEAGGIRTSLQGSWPARPSSVTSAPSVRAGPRSAGGGGGVHPGSSVHCLAMSKGYLADATEAPNQLTTLL